MKRLFLWTTAILLAVSTLRAETYVCIVGISNYPDSQNNLPPASMGAVAFMEAMKHHTEHITMLTSQYATKSGVLSKLKSICKKAGKDDTIIFYYSGHGYDGGLFVYDGQLPYEYINAVLGDAQSEATLCFIDACHSGSVSQTVNNATYSNPSKQNIIYMMGCRADETATAWEYQYKGLFTQGLLKGIRGKADANGDKKITMKELFNYTYNDVQHSTAGYDDLNQHPQLVGSKALLDYVVVDWNGK